MAEGPTSMSLGQQGLGVPEVWPLGCEVARRGDETQIGIQGHEGHRDGRFLVSARATDTVVHCSCYEGPLRHDDTKAGYRGIDYFLAKTKS